MSAAIYKILNEKNGRYYIGSSVNINARFYEHKYDLERNKHKNIFLQRDWIKSGKESFNFLILEEVEVRENTENSTGPGIATVYRPEQRANLYKQQSQLDRAAMKSKKNYVSGSSLSAAV